MTIRFVLQILLFSTVISDMGRLEELLIWLTGADHIPGFGFDTQPEIYFGHASMLVIGDATATYPVVDTCNLRLRLPLSPCYAVFKERLLCAMNVTTFTEN